MGEEHTGSILNIRYTPDPASVDFDDEGGTIHQGFRCLWCGTRQPEPHGAVERNSGPPRIA